MGVRGAAADTRPMASEKELAFVLPAADVAGSAGAVCFAGFPGVWAPDVPIAVSELGFESVQDARAARDATASVLRDVKVDTGTAPMPERPNHLPSGPLENAAPAPAPAAVAPATGGDA